MRIFVGCSPNSNVPLEYRDLASNIATMLANNGHKLVFKGEEEGMSGKCFMTFKYEGAKTKAIIESKSLDELKDLEVDAYEVEMNTFDRTKKIYSSSEVVLILPGGLGTLAELFAFIEEKKNTNSDKAIILFNYNNFYTPLLMAMKDSFSQGFISESELKRIDVVTDVRSLELYLKTIEKKKKEDDKDEKWNGNVS